MIKLRRLTVQEDEEFKIWCAKDGLINNNLDQEDFPGEAISTNVEIDEDKTFDNKFELGKYLYERLGSIPENTDTRVWHFLVIVYHKQLLKNNGEIGETGRFYLDIQKSFHSSPHLHLLKSVFDVYNFYSKSTESIKYLLLNPINESSKLFLEIVKRQDIMKNKNFIQASRILFYDDKENKIKRGVEEATLRLIDLFKQYERTYDLYSMPADKILDNLISKHEEFNTFKLV